MTFLDLSVKIRVIRGALIFQEELTATLATDSTDFHGFLRNCLEPARSDFYLVYR